MQIEFEGLLAKIPPENLHEEVATGEAEGREAELICFFLNSKTILKLQEATFI